MNADIDCRDGQYEISDHKFRGIKPWKIEKGESFNAFCHVEGMHKYERDLNLNIIQTNICVL